MARDKFYPKERITLKFCVLIACCVLLAGLGISASFTFTQVVSLVIFASSVIATLLFWDFRVAIAFWGIAVLVLTKTIDIEHLVLFSSLEVILFLVGMMVIVGLLREANVFNWILCRLLTLKNMHARKLIWILSLTSALLASTVDEVTSILFMVALVLQLAAFFEVNPIPLLIISVISTNIGSTGTVLGNPIGILIATKAGLTFEDFLIWAFPLMLLILVVVTSILLFWYKHYIKELDAKIKSHTDLDDSFRKLVCVPMTSEIRKELFIFVATLAAIALHHRIEAAFNLTHNSLLLSMPLIFAGAIMVWRRDKAKDYIEKDVDWWTLIFFMLLFAKVGALKFTGVTDIFSNWIIKVANGSQFFLTTFVLWASAIGSSILDNVVLVATFIPVINGLKLQGINVYPLWWALLFGGCLGGNITMVGSTANIVALGFLEKKTKYFISFFQWLRIGWVVGLISTLIVWFALIFLTPFMPSEIHN